MTGPVAYRVTAVPTNPNPPKSSPIAAVQIDIRHRAGEDNTGVPNAIRAYAEQHCNDQYKAYAPFTVTEVVEIDMEPANDSDT